MVQVDILTRCCSDHHPVLVNFSNARSRNWQKGRAFLFEAGWTKHKDHGSIIKQVWRPKKRDDQWCTTHNQIESAFISYFSNLFKAGNVVDLDDCLDAVEKKVTDEMNSRLLAEATIEEISTAMQGMSPLKALAQMVFLPIFTKPTGRLSNQRYAKLSCIFSIWADWVMVSTQHTLHSFLKCKVQCLCLISGQSVFVM